MKTILFPEQTVVIAKDQPEYLQIPAYKYQNDLQGRTVFCWKPNLKERLQILFGAVIWHHVLTFNQRLQPQLLTLDKPDMPSYDRTK